MATFKPNSSAFKEMAVGPEVTRVVLEIATKGLPIAQALSADFTNDGDYLANFNVRADIAELRTGFGAHPVAAGVLENTSGHAAAVEWGNKHSHKAHHVLGRTLEAMSHD